MRMLTRATFLTLPMEATVNAPRTNPGN